MKRLADWWHLHRPRSSRHYIRYLKVQLADQTDRACAAETEALRWKTRYVGFREGTEDMLEKVAAKERAVGMWQGLGTRVEIDRDYSQ